MTSFRALVHVVAVVSLAGCASSGAGNNSTVAPTPDPRVGLKPGLKDAGQAAWNLRLITNVPPSEKFVGSTNSDLSFYKNYVIQGNYNGSVAAYAQSRVSLPGVAERRVGVPESALRFRRRVRRTDRLRHRGRA